MRKQGNLAVFCDFFLMCWVNWRVAYITVAESARRWILGDFTVMPGNTPLVTCALNAGICDVNLPD